MRRFLRYRWMGIYLLAAVGSGGCQHSCSCCSSCAGATGRSCLSKWTCGACNSSRPNSTCQGMAAGSVPSKFVLTSAPKTTPTDAIRSSFTPSSYAPTTTVPAEREQLTSAPSADATTDVAASADVSAEPRFGHDADYHSLIGILDYSRIQQAWVLRYVSYEEEDRYGGSVTLVAPSRLMQFKAGQSVRVEGDLIDPESRQLRPAFQVRTIRAAQS